MVTILFLPGRMALTDPDEARYAQASREMLRGGDLIVPRFNGEPRLSKPALIHWLQAPPLALLGDTETAARLPSLMAASALLLLTAWWAERRLGAGTGGPAAMALATCLVFFVCARLAITDMLLALFVTAALMAWHEATSPDAAHPRALSWSGAAAIGVAALAKGPVGPALAGAIILLVSLAARFTRTAPRRHITARGTALAAAAMGLLCGPWLAALAARIGPDQVLEVARRETMERTLFGLDHPRPFYYFLAAFWLVFLPWSLALPFAMARARRAASPPEPVTVLLCCWLGGTVLFFSLSADKNDAWLLPAAPAVALLSARWLPRRFTLIVSAAAGAMLIAAVLFASGSLSRERSLQELALAMKPRPVADELLIGFKIYRPSLVFYADHTVRWVTSGKELRGLLRDRDADRPVTIVMESGRWDRLNDDTRGLLLARCRLTRPQVGYVALVPIAAGEGD